ncbi:serine protease inhibitor 28Dc-like [Aedes albopictus]|uniref:Serpin domain-containing protein n=1 Tax=Aedes albopictus TaxID=7160 RepID=A0ABM1ZAU3_AEDAL
MVATDSIHIVSVMRVRPNIRDSVEIKLANGVFAPKGMQFDQKFQLIAERFYGLETHYVDFRTKIQNAIQTINAWVQRLTHGRISQIVAKVNTTSMLVLTNTLFFKATWTKQTCRERTHDGKWRLFPLLLLGDLKTQVLGIPYKEKITLYAFLPDNSTKDKVRLLQTRLNTVTLNDVISKMEMKVAAVQFPKLHVQNSLNLKQTLEQLGATAVFNQAESDLSHIWRNRTAVSVFNYNDAFDILEDTRKNAIIELRHQHGNCVIIEKDVSSRVLCEENELCRFKGGACVCCAALGPGKRYRRGYDGYFNFRLYVNEILHKIDLVVNEKGTESGAVVVPFMDRNFPQVNFKVNGPFLILVRHEKTKLPLYYGAVFDPRF